MDLNKSPKVKFLYWVLYRTMDLESLLWDIADFIIKPTAIFKGFLVRKIAKILEIKVKNDFVENVGKSEKQESV